MLNGYFGVGHASSQQAHQCRSQVCCRKGLDNAQGWRACVLYHLLSSGPSWLAPHEHLVDSPKSGRICPASHGLREQLRLRS